MTTEQIENLVRASLAERAGDVEVTPALYEEVQRRASRGVAWRRGFALAGAAVAVVAVAALLPQLVSTPAGVDVVETPDESLPEPTLDLDSAIDLFEGGVGDAGVATTDGTTVQVAERAVFSPRRVVRLEVGPGWTPDAGVVVAGREDGSVGIVDQAAGEGDDQFDHVLDVEANGAGVVVSARGDAVAWIEGRDLHVLSLAAIRSGADVDEETTVIPLGDGTPDVLVLEQWAQGIDDQVLLASHPDGGLWTVAMRDTTAIDTARTSTPTEVFEAEDAFDGVLLDDGTVLVVAPGPEVYVLTQDGERRPIAIDELFRIGAQLTVSGDGGRAVWLHEASTWTGALLVPDEDLGWQGASSPYTFQGGDVVAGVPLASFIPDGSPTPDVGGGPPPAEAGELPLAAMGMTPVDLVGTDGVDLLLRDADTGEVTRVPLSLDLPDSPVLGRVAAVYGSYPEEALLAVELLQLGERVVQLIALDGGEVLAGLRSAPLAGPVTGLAWAPDASGLAITDATGAMQLIALAKDSWPPARLSEVTATSSVVPGAVRGWTWDSYASWDWDDLPAPGEVAGQLLFDRGVEPSGVTVVTPIEVDSEVADGLFGLTPDWDATAEQGVFLRDVLTQGLAMDGNDPGLLLQVNFEQLVLTATMGNPTVVGSVDLTDALVTAEGRTLGSDDWRRLELEAVRGSVVLRSADGAWLVEDRGVVTLLPAATHWAPLG